MPSWKLYVEDYGRIKHAEIEAAPLTLFVGDNNSGKSYLLALLWGIRNLGTSAFMGEQYLNLRETERVEQRLLKLFDDAKKDKKSAILLEEIADDLELILNKALESNKGNLVKKIFNSDSVRIGELKIKFINVNKTCLHCEYNEELRTIHIFINKGNEFGISVNFAETGMLKKDKMLLWLMIKFVCGSILKANLFLDDNTDDNVYLPAARTGFMLTKDIINKYGRNNTFNLVNDKETVTPFIRPINHFLDVMGDLSLEKKGRKKNMEIADNIESEMAHGTIEFSSMPNKEVKYVPNGYQQGIPLRVSSAVVTELSPLVLILKHNKYVNRFFYEEPEMCLHPQLQQKMGKVIGRIVNNGIEMVVTTHSDIILQHINNMIKLGNRQDCQQICKKLGYTEDDILKSSQIRVYQFNEEDKGKTEVQELMCGENGFCVPTFNDALDRIMDEAYEIQG